MNCNTSSNKTVLSERYVAATQSNNLTLVLDSERRTDADVLLAAGYAQAGNARATLALALDNALQILQDEFPKIPAKQANESIRRVMQA